jgi:hypothetical protein
MIQLLTRSTFLVSTQTIKLAPVLALGVNLLLPHLPRDPYSHRLAPRQKVLLLQLLPTTIVTFILIPRLLFPQPRSSLLILPK